jgi:hypothetical protein
LAGDENHQIIACEFRNTDVDDPSALADLLKQLERHLTILLPMTLTMECQ